MGFLYARYRPIRTPESFFPDGIPDYNPLAGLSLRRRFDFTLILLSILSTVMLLISATLYVVLSTRTSSVIMKPYITVPCGQYQGFWENKSQILKFYNIPYAEPPTPIPQQEICNFMRNECNRRWKDSRPIRNILKDCLISHASRCFLRDTQWRCDFSKPYRTCTTYAYLGYKKNEDLGLDEDCLGIDLTMPKELKSKNVIVVLASEGGIVDSAVPPTFLNKAFYPTDEIVNDYGVIWIRVSYRIGFYSALGEKNYARSDIKNSLKWISNNIAHFGGDPKMITLLAYGSSATLIFQMISMGDFDKTNTLKFWLSSPDGYFPKKLEKTIPSIILGHLIKQIPGTHVNLTNEQKRNKVNSYYSKKNTAFFYKLFENTEYDLFDFSSKYSRKFDSPFKDIWLAELDVTLNIVHDYKRIVISYAIDELNGFNQYVSMSDSISKTICKMLKLLQDTNHAPIFIINEAKTRNPISLIPTPVKVNKALDKGFRSMDILSITGKIESLAVKEEFKKFMETGDTMCRDHYPCYLNEHGISRNQTISELVNSLCK